VASPPAKGMLDAPDPYLGKHRLLPSQLRFAAFLTDHFGEELVAERREREVSARQAAISQPPPVAEPAGPAEPARPRRFPMPDLDLDDAEANTVLKPAPRAPASFTTPTAGRAQARVPDAAAGPTPAASAVPRASPGDAKLPTPPAEPVSTTHLGLAALALMAIAALLGGGLFYLLVR